VHLKEPVLKNLNTGQKTTGLRTTMSGEREGPVKRLGALLMKEKRPNCGGQKKELPAAGCTVEDPEVLEGLQTKG